MASTHDNYSYLALYGDILIDKGLDIRPIKRGTKHPNRKGWEDMVPNKESLNKWVSNGYANGGVGLFCRDFPTIDIDVRNKDDVKTMVKICEEELGCDARYIKMGQFPKVSIICRTETPFTKIASVKYRDELEMLQTGAKVDHQVEILGDGQQTVIYAEHPETHKPYRWNRKSLVDDEFEISLLPVLTPETARTICRRFETEVAARHPEWEPRTTGQCRTVLVLLPTLTQRTSSAGSSRLSTSPEIRLSDWLPKRTTLTGHHGFVSA